MLLATHEQVYFLYLPFDIPLSHFAKTSQCAFRDLGYHLIDQ